MSIQIYADTSDLDQIAKYAQDPTISGFTTNPSLCRAAGVTEYEVWGQQVLRLVNPKVKAGMKPVSFEVLSDTLDDMFEDARDISAWGPGIVYVKIPIQTVTGESTAPLIRRLSRSGHRVNVTAVMTSRHVETAIEALWSHTPAIISVFNGRIMDTGLQAWRPWTRRTHALFLWASARQIFDLYEAEHAAFDIVTLAPALLDKRALYGKDLDQYSLETVQQFSRDAKAAGLTLRRAIVPAEADSCLPSRRRKNTSWPPPPTGRGSRWRGRSAVR